MARGTDTISQRIALEGAEEILRKLQELGVAGEAAIKQIQDATNSSGGSLSHVSGLFQTAFAAFHSTAKAFEPVGHAIGEMREKFHQFGEKINEVAERIIPHFREVLELGVAAATLELGRFVVESARGVREVQNLANAVGLSLDDFEALALVSKKAGIEEATLATLMSRFARSLGQAREEHVKLTGEVETGVKVFHGAAGAVQEVSEAVTVLRGNAQKTGESVNGLVTVLRGGVKPVLDFSNPWKALKIDIGQFADTMEGNKAALMLAAERLSKMGESTMKAAIAAQLFGRGWREAIPMLTNLKERLSEAGHEIEGFHLSVTELEKTNVKNFLAAWEELGNVIKRTAQIIANMIGGQIAPALQTLKNLIGQNSHDIQEWGFHVAKVVGSIVNDFVKMVQGVSDQKIENQSLVHFRDFLVAFGHTIAHAFHVVMEVLGGVATAINFVFGTHLTGPILLGIIVAEHFVKTIELVIAAFHALHSTWIVAIKILTTLVNIARSMALAMAGISAASLPLIALVAIFTAIAAAVFLLFGPTEQVGQLIRKVFGDDAANAFNQFVANFRAAKDKFIENFYAFIDSIKNLWSSFWGYVFDRINSFIQNWKDFLESVKNLWNSAWQAISDWFFKTIDGILSYLQPLLDKIKEAIKFAEKLASFVGGAPGTAAVPYAGGGLIRGPGTKTSDSVLIRASTGEGVITADAVQHYGGAGFIDAINSMRLPMMAAGGIVSALTALPGRLGFAGGGIVPAGAGGGGDTLNLTIGTELFEGLISPRATTDKILRYSRSRQMQSAGRKPGWHG